MAHSHTKEGALHVDANPGVPFNCDQKDPRGSTEDSVCSLGLLGHAVPPGLGCHSSLLRRSLLVNLGAVPSCPCPQILSSFKRRRYFAQRCFGTETPLVLVGHRPVAAPLGTYNFRKSGGANNCHRCLGIQGKKPHPKAFTLSQWYIIYVGAFLNVFVP